MSTIERALEKQRQLAAKKRALEEEKRKCSDITPEQKVVQSEQAEFQPYKTFEPAEHKDASREQAGSRQKIEIDINRLEANGFITPAESFTKIKEEYRYIKRPLLNNAFGANSATLNNPNLIIVSSSFSGEGKTFTAINLAISMALEQDRNVLLIDADVVRPHLCERLEIEERPGLMDFLTGNVNITDIIHDTNIDKLKVVTAGRRHHHSSEMLASHKMATLMKELSTRYSDRVVIFDTSPLLGASETGVLSQNAGQAVVVVEEGRTTHAQLEQALRLLDPDIATNLVLNKSNAGRSDYYGYYYAAN